MKKRKILTKLGIIFGIIDLILILIGVLFFKPKTILAEESTTPDYFINNELYMFDAHTNIPPNFETGYYDKILITENDISNDNNYFGWYRNLGYRQLIIPYFQPNEGEDVIFVMFGVKLFGCLAKTFSIAYEVSSPMLLDFYLFFSDGTYEEWNTEENGFGRQILTISPANLEKNCLYFCWQADSPDYVPSLKFMGISDSYNFGYNDGFKDGHRDGYTTGYNGGYQAGYRAGTSSDAILYTTLLDFNQQILNGDFEDNISYWSTIDSQSQDIIFTTSDNIASIKVLNTQQTNFYLGIKTTNMRTGNVGDKIYLKMSAKSDSSNFYLRVGYYRYISQRVEFLVNSNWQTFSGVYEIGEINRPIWIFPQSPDELTTNESYYLKNIMLINLTIMYGSGNEPTLEQCDEIFKADYYSYTLSTPVEIGYYNGYLDGENEGIQKGINIGETNQINMSWIQSIFQAMQGFFNIQIFPRVTLGIIVGIPFVISLAWFVIKMFRGGGGGED